MLQKLKAGIAGLLAPKNLSQPAKWLIFITLLLAGWALATGNTGAAIGLLMIGGIPALVIEIVATGGSKVSR